MKFFKHPIHIMLIHFPSAMLPMDLACYGISYYNHDASFLTTSFYALLGAVVLGWLAGIFGLIDLARIPKENTRAMSKALIHGGINLSVIIIYTVIAWSSFKKFPALPAATLTMLILKAALVVFMILGNYIGGSLILKEKIGIET